MVAAQLLADTDSTKFVQGIAIVKIALAFNFFFFFCHVVQSSTSIVNIILHL